MAMAQRLVVLLILASIAVAVLADDIAGAASVEAQKYKHHDKEDDYKPAKHPGYKRHADDDEPDYDKYGHKYEPSRPKYKSHEGKAPSYDKDGDYYTYPADPKPTPNPLDACEPGTLTEVKRITQSWNTGTKNQVASCTDASLPGYNATATLQVGGECSLDPCTNPDGYDKVHLNKVKWMAGDAAGPFNATVNTQCAAGARLAATAAPSTPLPCAAPPRRACEADSPPRLLEPGLRPYLFQDSDLQPALHSTPKAPKSSFASGLGPCVAPAAVCEGGRQRRHVTDACL